MARASEARGSYIAVAAGRDEPCAEFRLTRACLAGLNVLGRPVLSCGSEGERLGPPRGAPTGATARVPANLIARQTVYGIPCVRKGPRARFAGCRVGYTIAKSSLDGGTAERDRSLGRRAAVSRSIATLGIFLAAHQSFGKQRMSGSGGGSGGLKGQRESVQGTSTKRRSERVQADACQS